MIFAYSKEWIEETNKRCIRRTIIEGIITVLLIVASVITGNTYLYILAGISVVLFVPDLYVLPKRKLYREAHSVEVTDAGLVLRNYNHQPICVKWKNLQVNSIAKKNDKLESITMMENSGIGKIELEGLENMDKLEKLINEKISDL